MRGSLSSTTDGTDGDEMYVVEAQQAWKGYGKWPSKRDSRLAFSLQEIEATSIDLA